MTTAFLNGDYMALDEARISPMDRGFLFGDGIYEVIPVHDGKPIGFSLHIDRMKKGLSAVEINLDWTHDQWRDICDKLVDKNGAGNLAVYLHVSRGADTKRHHAYPKGITPTVFGFASEIAASLKSGRTAVTPLKISSAEDKRWRRCDIKSTALLGNIIHFQKGQAEGNDETLLFNAAGELTEGSATNVFVVKDSVITTPPLDHQVLPGVTRLMLLDMLRKDGSVPVEERVVTMEEARQADEIWLTSSTKEVAPVVRLDGKPVGSG
ncbi:MAG: aminotransferase class IV, partial [Woeseiaceae bacterium]